jgi:hypothetical protein
VGPIASNQVQKFQKEVVVKEIVNRAKNGMISTGSTDPLSLKDKSTKQFSEK